MDSLLREGYSTIAGTASRVAPHVIPTGNSSSVMVAASGNLRGPTSSDKALEAGATIDGKLSLGMIGFFVGVLILAYLWTRNVQGGG